ncbi:MAG TPA: DUF6600 domain-containing protein [Terracidiphilus sp.]
MLRVFAFSPRSSPIAIAVAACLALFPLVSTAQDDPPPQAGRLSVVNGTVSIQPAGTQDWGQAYLNYPVGPGDRIFTDSDGRAEIQVGRTYVRVGPSSDVTFVDFTSNDITFGAAQGSLHIRTLGLWDGQSLYIQTPSGSSTVTGPADFRVDVYPDEQTTLFTNDSGDVYVSGANDFGMDTGSGQALELVGTNPVYPQWLQPAGSDDLDNWSERRDQQIARAASFRYVSAEAPGVEDLDSYGQWMPGTDYGDMWFPSVPVGWAPYRYGHWINRDPWGWTWVEDEPWGYAPFHFGRWINYRGRWGWVPGPRAEHPVWSPALVVFAGGIQAGGSGVSVWFPLGPGEAYRPWYPCSPRYVDRVNITNIQETRVVHVQKTYVNIVNVTNITYVNRTAGVTAIRHEDFAAGRPVARAAVDIDPQQMAHVQVIARPEVAPTTQAKISAPPARRVPVAVARPVLIDAKGLAVAAQPRAKPLQPPVKTAPPPPRLPNRTVIAPPPNVKMTPAARQAMQTAPVPRPGQQPASAPQQPAANRPALPPVPAHPAGTTPPSPGERPGQLPPNEQKPAPIPTPGIRPPAQPQAPPRPPEQPHPTHQPTQPIRSTEKPVPVPELQPPPPTHSVERPAPEPVPPPREHPAPQPKPENPPPAHAARPPSQSRPNSEPASKAPEKQQPQPEKEKKPKEEPEPQS